VTAPSYRPLLDACAGYLSAYSPAHVRAFSHRVLVNFLSERLFQIHETTF
jgi:hypothetical protein